MKNVHEGTKKSGRKFLLGAEYDSWVLKFERRKNTAVGLGNLKSPEQKKTREKYHIYEIAFQYFPQKILSQNENSKKKIFATLFFLF